MSNQGRYKIAYLTCDGLLYGFYDTFTAEVDDEVEEDSKGNTYIGGSVFFEGLAMTVPQKIAGLVSVLG